MLRSAFKVVEQPPFNFDEVYVACRAGGRELASVRNFEELLNTVSVGNTLDPPQRLWFELKAP